ncbi:MAG: hypothetical protein R6U85_04340 [Salinivirgaceae bacterium]
MKLQLLGVALLLTMGLNAQQEEMRYLFSDKDYSISGFGAPIYEFSTYDGGFGMYMGGGGAVIFNNTFYVGGFGMGLATDHHFPEIYSENGNLLESELTFDMGYGGLWIGYIFMPNNPVHFGISSKFGAGAITVYDSEFKYSEYEYHNDFIGTISPQLEIEMNLTRWFKVNIGAGYRFVTGVSDAEYIADADGTRKTYFTDSDFSAPYGNISLMFGGFGPKKK